MKKLDKDNISGITGLTRIQEGILFHYLKNKGDNMYNVQLSLRLNGALRADLLKRAFYAVQHDNDALRSVFRWEKIRKPVRVVLNTYEPEFLHTRIDTTNGQPVEEQLSNLLQEDRQRLFDLTELPFRVHLIELHSDQFVLCVSHHHILYDGWSTGILLHELFTHYTVLTQGNQLVPVVKMSSVDMVTALAKKSPKENAAEFWKEFLKDHHFTPLSVSTDNSEVERPSIGRKAFSFPLMPVEQFASGNRVTKAAVFYLAFAIVLQRYTGSGDVVFGTTVSGRDPQIPGMDRVIGNFINTIPMRIQLDTLENVSDAVKRIGAQLIQREEFSADTYNEIRQMAGWGVQDLLFDSAVVVENYPIDDTFTRNTKGLEISLNDTFEKTDIPFLLVVQFRNDCAEIAMCYHEGAMKHIAMDQFARSFEVILRSITADPLIRTDEVELLSQQEKDQLIHSLANTNVAYPENETIVSLFNRQAVLHSNRTAVRFGESSITYGELHERSSAFAYLLRQQGVGKDVLVGLYMERSIDMIVALFAILKAGGAYLPADVDYPEARVRYLFENSGAQIMVTEANRQHVGAFCRTVITIPDRYPVQIPIEDVLIDPSSLCYVIYTSGTTGNPKGVMIEHRNVVRLFYNEAFQFAFGSDDTWTMFHSHCFDFSVWEIFGALLFGGQLVVVPKAVAIDTRAYLRLLQQEKVTVLNQTPSAFYNLQQQMTDNPAVQLHLRYIIFGGEALSPGKLLPWKNRYPDTRVINMFGITETTVHVTYREINDKDISGNISNIGKPIPTLSVYLLDESGRLVPPGAAGEICVTGAGVARGYLNNMELTEKKFGVDPYQPKERMYRSGDLGRLLPSGDLEYLGRMDEQVKIRGFRIELGEIAHQLNRHPQVKEAVVIAVKDSNGQRLIAYYVAEGQPEETSLRNFVSGFLPDYMVPAFFVKIESIPLTSNGKLDRKQLPVPVVTRNEQYVGATGEIENKLTEIWSELLHIPAGDISTDRNFFDMGGDSVKMISLSAAIQKAFTAEVSITELFSHSTIQKLAVLIRSKTEKENEPDMPAGSDKQWADPVSDDADQSIAIIGMAGRFPGASDIDEFWQNLVQAKDTISRELPDAVASLVKAKGRLADYEMFDESFFNYIPSEATCMDPQIRVFHECVWNALENAGYSPYQYTGKIGLYAGASPNPYFSIAAEHLVEGDWSDKWDTLTYADKDYLCSRIAYKLNLKGPVVTVNTACSTSLVATDAACTDLLTGKCDMAVAGGVSITLHDENGYRYQKDMILSPDGICRAFDEQARGTVGGNGAAAVVLKRLTDALRDGDPVYAVIRATATNNDGADKAGFTAPSSVGQAAVIQTAIRKAGIAPETIRYVEAHGTGTILGDPIEVEGLIKAFNTSKKNFCAIGSVKTNIGHLDAAAGVTGLIKAALTLYRKTIPASLYFEKANPAIDFTNSPFFVAASTMPLQRNETPLRASVSSFGIGGTNAHVILEEAPVTPPAESADEYQLLVFSAKTPAALERNIRRLSEYIRANNGLSLAAVAYTLQTGRAAFDYRKAIVCRTTVEIPQRCDEIVGTDFSVQKILKGTPRIVLMFSGQGSQYAGMCAELYHSEKVFRETVDHCCHLLHSKYGLDLLPHLFLTTSSVDSASINRTEITQPALFVIEYSMTQLLLSVGVQPFVMLGHSIGEYVAACISGVFSLEDALYLVVWRGAVMAKANEGRMMSIAVSEMDLLPLLAANPEIALAAVNSTDLCTVAGPAEPILQFQAAAESRGYRCRLLHTSHAFHSAMMDPVLDEYRAVMNAVTLHPPRIPFLLNVNGEYANESNVCQPEYWVRQLRNTVRFSSCAATLLQHPELVFIETGPGSTLCTFIASHKLRNEQHHVISTIRGVRDNDNDVRYWQNAIGELWTLGVKTDWGAMNKTDGKKRIVLPGYSFERRPYPVKMPEPAKSLVRKIQNAVASVMDFTDWFYTPTWKLSIPFTDKKHEHKEYTTLLFSWDESLAKELQSAAQADGQKWIIAVKGISFKKRNEAKYLLNFGDSGDIASLFSNLKQAGISPGRIVFYAGNTTTSVNRKKSNQPVVDIHGNLYTLHRIIQTAVNENAFRSGELIVAGSPVYTMPGEVMSDAETASIQSLLTVFVQENPSFTARLIDTGSSLTSKQGSKAIARLVLQEINDRNGGKVSCWRNGKKWIPVYDKIVLPDNKTAEGFVQEGVYLITGGLGNLGFALSNYLLKKYNARLILTGQSDPSESTEKLNRLRLLQEMADTGKVEYVRFDIADELALTKTLETIQNNHGAVNGIIHAAGINEGNSFAPLTEISGEALEKQFGPKANGIVALAKVTERIQPDFCVAVSSLSAILGGFNFGAYAAANQYMDMFIRAGKERGSLRNWISVNLDGLTYEKQDETGRMINTDELIRVFETIIPLREQLAQVIVSKTGFTDRLEQWVTNVDVKLLNATENNEAVKKDQQNSLTSHQAAIIGKPDVAAIWRSFFGRDDIGDQDDFFEIGGDSLKGLRLLGRLHKAMDIELSIKDLFANPTILELSDLISRKKNEKGKETVQAVTFTPIPSRPTAASYPVTSIQKRLYFLQQLNTQSVSYNLSLLCKIDGQADDVRLKAAFTQLIERYEILRTGFHLINDTIVQQPEPVIHFELEHINSETADTKKLMQDFVRPFNLGVPPLLRAAIIHTDSTGALLAIDMHHIITDAVSRDILFNEFMALYRGEAMQVPSLQFRDYAVWQLERQFSAEMQVHQQYWSDTFAHLPAPINLPADFSRPPMKLEEGNIIEFSLSGSISAELKKLCSQHDVSLFMLLLSTYSVLLAKLTGQEELVVGTPVAGRKHPDTEAMPGLFLNTLALLIFPSGDLSFTAFLQQVKQRSLIAFGHDDFQYEDLIDLLNVERDTSRNPLFDVWFMYHYRDTINTTGGDMSLIPVDYYPALSRFDLSLEIVESAAGISVRFEYPTSLFLNDTILRFVGYWKNIVEAVIKNQDILLKDMEILPPAERNFLQYKFNDTYSVYPKNETIVSLFAQQVNKTPEKTALVFGSRKYTFRDLDELSSGAAVALRRKFAIKPNDLIAIMAGRDEYMVISLLAILKAGAAYLPIDPSYPAERINYMLTDSGNPPLLLSNVAIDLIQYDGDIILYDELTGEHGAGLTYTSRPDDLCYMIYTSGSTGKPKGVKICHRNVVNFITGITREIPIQEQDCMLAITSISFDISVLELFWTLCNGVEVVLQPADFAQSGLNSLLHTEKTEMDFSLFFFSSYTNSDNNKYNLLLDSVKYADKNGFKAVWTPERHFHEFGGLYPNPSVISAALAMITRQIEIRSGSVVAPLHDPIRIAEEWSVVDNLSGGRIGLAFASGWNPNDFVFDKENYAARHKVMYDSIRTIQQIWRGEKLKRTNGVDKEVELAIYPVPVQPEIPVWITAAGSEDTFRSAGAMGANILTHLLGQGMDELIAKIKAYRDARKENGYEPEKGKVTIMLHTFVGDNAEEVERIVEVPFTEYLKSSLGLMTILKGEYGFTDGEIPEDLMKQLLNSAFKRYYKTSSLIGTHTKCIEMLTQLKAAGVDEIACLVDFGVEQVKVLESLKKLNEVKEMFTRGAGNLHSPVTMLQTTPAYIRMLNEGGASSHFLASLRVLMIGGDALPLSLLHQLHGKTNAAIYNMYGPTETTVWSSVQRMLPGSEKVTVGRPIANTQIYIVDKQLQLVPQGVVGELCIGGDGLSQGYHNRPELTDEKFVTNVYQVSSKLYKTGDLAKMLPDGTIELIGRADNQVKIRGFRIELGEIEYQLNSYADIQESVVIAREEGGLKYLTGYYVSPVNIEPATLRSHLQSVLPDYMVPSYFVQLAGMPLTANGKLDRRALPAPSVSNEREYIAPSDAKEALLCAVWEKVLGAARIGVTDNFFASGGDSIK
ncbi:MAG: amino acid adenylation domain-containing protein, partial [Bacteroidetes bacterium]|nr:amino acid adenylation domain-containing protein [Bacteroidota bacterium]